MTRGVVTGGNGLIAGWCAVLLLDAGHDVIATVRSRERQGAARSAIGRVATSIDRLEFAVADLLADDGWDEACSDADFVLHVASPLSSADDEVMIRASCEGTVRVLRAASRAGVQRVVMTSSCAAATPLSTQLAGTVDESCWTDGDEPGLSAYRRSKLLAERAAWDFVRDTAPAMELATVLPASVFGPALSADAMGSLQIIARLLDGSTPALPRLAFEVVDVRDVAAAHLLAMTDQAAAGERFIVAGELLWFAEVAAILREQLGDVAAKVPTDALPDEVMHALAESSDEIRALIPLLGRELCHSSAKAHALLGWTARAAPETIVASGRSIIELRGITDGS